MSPISPPRACSQPRCPHYVFKGGKCVAHYKAMHHNYNTLQRDLKRQKMYGDRWRKARLPYLREHPTCVSCGKAAYVIDHIRDHQGNHDLFWNQDNWQAMCKGCHDQKTMKEILSRGEGG